MSSETSKSVRVPALRFPEFEGEWERKKLGEVGNFVGGGTPETNVNEYWQGNIQWFTPTEIKLDFVSKSVRTITELGLKKSSAKLLPKGTILLTTRATIGEAAIATEECSTNQGFQSLIVNEKNSNIYVFNWIKMNKAELLKRANGSTFPEISKIEIEQIVISLPSLPEQKRIASFFTVLDQKLTKLKQKKNLLAQYKKGVMQQLFSQALRFKADDGKDFPDWERKKLGEVGEFKNGINKSAEDFGHGFPFVNLMDVFGKQTISNLNLDLVNATKTELQLYDLKKGDILFIRSSVKKSGVGETSLILEDLPDTVFSGFLIRFRDERINLNINFKKYCFANKNFRESLISLSTTSANTNINQESLKSLEIAIPVFEEQTKIANFLSAIDEKINQTQTQIQKTEHYKKGLLQKMFV
ncbi:restriction endonuclease subunit S [uncultured Mucilaginibacter sp.]|uniref:restriction endonuclease subunit S n=1 Tax=uncultured Mucilaginibacter sp. TaxID=797541 RepID=UPI00260391D5|nr:restriction endonuclease subunit S [uncultured Mucilaginibacter sp.]